MQQRILQIQLLLLVEDCRMNIGINTLLSGEILP